MKCPNCGLVNPDSAQSCGCGYDFQSHRNNASDSAPKAHHQIGEKEERLISAAVEGHTHVLKELLATGVDVNAKGNAGMTALMHAARNNHIECARILLEAGADVNAVNELGRTALKMAQERGYQEIVDLLAARGAVGPQTPGIEICFPDAQRRNYINLDELREDIIHGRVKKDYKARSTVSVNDPENKEPAWSTVEKICETDFKLKVLFRPIWAHTMKGLEYGAIAGIILKALDTTILFFRINPGLGLAWLLIVGSLFSKARWLPLPIMIFASRFGIPVMSLLGAFFGTMITGFIFGGPFGMFAGTLAGHFRSKSLPRAVDAVPEGGKPYYIGLVAAGLFLGFLIPFYLFGLSPRV